MKRPWKHLLLGGLVVFGAMQLIRPDREAPVYDANGTLEASFVVPPEVAALLRAACYDCHSYETRWPWYTHVAPVSWLIARDVEDGREHVNFSTIGLEAPEDRAVYLAESARIVREGEMPLRAYTWLHPEARLDAAARARLADWLAGAARER